MLKKSIKYSLFILLFILQSCLLLNEENEIENNYSCSMFTNIQNWSKSINPCSYSITYLKETEIEAKGFFQITLKNSSSTYYVYTNQVTLKKGTHTVIVHVDNCNFQDEIETICFFAN